MKILGFYISRLNWAHEYVELKSEQSKSWLDLITANKGMAEEIERLERELNKYKPIRDGEGRFVSKKKHMTEVLKAERSAKIENEHIPDWGSLKQAYKNEEFGR